MHATLVILSLAAACALAGCSVVQDFGQGMQQVGQDIEDSARKK